MKKVYKWGSSGNPEYDLVLKDGQIKEYRNVACFNGLRDYDCTQVETIILYNFDCELTKDYRDWYLQYIIDMLALKNAKFDDKSFQFQAFTCSKKNMLVASITRILWEQMFMKTDSDNVEWFLKPLKESEIDDKLARFCKVFKDINNLFTTQDYLHEGHLPIPKKVIIKYTKDFIATDKLSSVNSFFYNK